MTAPAGAAYVASSKLISVIGSMVWKLVEPDMKGLNLSPGRIDEISTLSKEQREDSLAGDLSKNTTQFREYISLRSGWVIGEESEDMS